MKKFIFGILAVVLIGFTFAHQPRLVFKQPAGEIIDVKNPEISQAFYGNLNGQEDLYQIDADEGFLLYVNILVPDVSEYRTDFTVEIIENNYEAFTRLEGRSFEWEKFFEPFGGDAYFRGPTLEKNVGPGTYVIRVSNSDNQGKYSLAIGKKEKFSIGDMLRTYRDMPALKMQFFEQPRYMIFWNLVGLFLLLIFVVIFFILRGVHLIIKKRKNRKIAGI